MYKINRFLTSVLAGGSWIFLEFCIKISNAFGIFLSGNGGMMLSFKEN